MKRIFFIPLTILVSISACTVKNSSNGNSGYYLADEASDKRYIAEVISALDQVKSASYTAKFEAFAPGDTLPFSSAYSYYKEYDNPADTTIGASFIKLMPEDTTKMTFCYDGTMKAFIDWRRNYMEIDSFYTTKFEFRPMRAPFFNYSKNILKYALENKDSTAVILRDFGDSVQVSLSIYAHKQVEFFGKAFFTGKTYGLDEEVSKYDIWINKFDNLPYRVRREMTFETTVFTCISPKTSKSNSHSFVASDYLPTNIPLGTRTPEKNNLIGKVAPDWMLKSADNKMIGLRESKSKAFMIQFTSVTCGPCRLSVPFLNKLTSEYTQEDFNFVSIEKSTKSIEALKKYQVKSDINYPLLMSTDDATKSYKIDLVPVFFILDKDRIVRDVIMGYRKGKTDKEIREAISKLIS